MKDGCSIPYTCGLVLTLNKFVVIATNSSDIIAIYIDENANVNIVPQEQGHSSRKSYSNSTKQ